MKKDNVESFSGQILSIDFDAHKKSLNISIFRVAFFSAFAYLFQRIIMTWLIQQFGGTR